jgi:hypothetical protein
MTEHQLQFEFIIDNPDEMRPKFIGDIGGLKNPETDDNFMPNEHDQYVMDENERIETERLHNALYNILGYDKTKYVKDDE